MSRPFAWWADLARLFWADQFNAAVNARNIPAAKEAQQQYDRYADRSRA